MPAGKIQKFDPKAFARMRGDIQQEQGQAARIASRASAKKPAKPAIDPLQTATGGLSSRKKLANRLQK